MLAGDVRQRGGPGFDGLDMAAAGEDVVISRNGKPLVRITRLAGPRSGVRLGLLKDKVRVSADFGAPLPQDVLAGFEGR